MKLAGTAYMMDKSRPKCLDVGRRMPSCLATSFGRCYGMEASLGNFSTIAVFHIVKTDNTPARTCTYASTHA